MIHFACTDESAEFLTQLMKLKIGVDRGDVEHLLQDVGAHINTLMILSHIQNFGGVHVVFIHLSSSITFVYVQADICSGYCLKLLARIGDRASETLPNQPQDTYMSMRWRPAPAVPANLADGTPRLYVGPPPEDPEGRSKHYQCFCSLVWGARLQREPLHAKRAKDLYLEAENKHQQHVLEHGIQPDQEDCDETGPSFLALLGEQTLKKEDVVNDVSLWESQWKRELMQRQRELQDTVDGVSTCTAKQRTQSRFHAMMNNAYGSRKNYIHFMTHGAYLLNSRHLSPPLISVEAAEAAASNGGAHESTSRIHPLQKRRPRFMNPGKRSEQRYKHCKNMWADARKYIQGEDVQRTGKAFNFVVDRINGDTRLETWPAAPGQSDAQPKASHECVAHHMQQYVPGFAKDVRGLDDARKNGLSASWTCTSPPATHSCPTHDAWYQSSGKSWWNHSDWWQSYTWYQSSSNDSSSFAAGG